MPKTIFCMHVEAFLQYNCYTKITQFSNPYDGMGLFGEAVLAPAIVAVCRVLIRKILKILGFRV